MAIAQEILDITIQHFGPVRDPLLLLMTLTKSELDQGNPENHGYFYTGAVIDYTKTEPIIYRPPSDDGTVKFLRTPQYDTDWLSGKFHRNL